MEDFNPIINRMLLKLCKNVENDFPPSSAEFPIITFTITQNSSHVVIENVERLSSVTVQVDVWDNSRTRQKCEKLASDVSKLMLSVGFTRRSAVPIKENGLHRQSMTFVGVIDPVKMIIYTN